MPLTTLIVDDEPLAREGLRMLLAADAAFAEIREARDGSEAVAQIRSRRPDLLFLDVQMPEMDGFAVVREIGPERMPPVVFVTAHDRYAIQQQRRQLVAEALARPRGEDRERAAAGEQRLDDRGLARAEPGEAEARGEQSLRIVQRGHGGVGRHHGRP